MNLSKTKIVPNYTFYEYLFFPLFFYVFLKKHKN